MRRELTQRRQAQQRRRWSEGVAREATLALSREGCTLTWASVPNVPPSAVLQTRASVCNLVRIKHARRRLVDRLQDRPRQFERAARLQQSSDVVHVDVAVCNRRRKLGAGAKAHKPLPSPADLRPSRRADDHGVVGDRLRLAHGLRTAYAESLDSGGKTLSLARAFG